jgi:hypothetical protein
LLHTASTLPQHAEQVNASLIRNEQACMRSRSFVEAFIRPYGIDVSATPIFVREVEKLCGLAVEASRDVSGRGLLRAALTPFAALARVPAAAPLVSSAHERAIAARDRAHREEVAAAWQVKDALKEAEQRQKEERLARRQRDKERRAAEWRRAKTMNKLKQRIKKRIGLAS